MPTCSYSIFLLLLLIGCKPHPGERETVVVTVHDTVYSEIPDPPPPPPPGHKKGLSITAHLVYGKDSLSSFDVLNDSSLALWNTIIGGGDAGAPSKRVEIRISGEMKAVRLQVKNGNHYVFDELLDHTISQYSIGIDNTGCEPVLVKASRGSTILLEKEIPFHCGE